MAANSFLSNQGTQSALLTDNTGGTGGTLIPVMKVSMDGQGTFTNGNIFQGTILQVNNIGTIPNIPGGSIAVTSLPTLNIASGSINGTVNIGNTPNIGTIGTVGLATASVSSLPNIPGGTIGSVIGIGSVSGLSNLPQGSINVTAGTITAGTVNLGTVVGKDANAVAQTGNPIGIGGTDSGGTIRTALIDSSGRFHNVMEIGTVSSLPNLPQGSINITAGTIATLGTMGTLGLVNTITTISNLTNGSIHVTAGTEVVTSGTVTLVSAVGTMGTLGLGTVRQDARTTQNILSFGTQVSGTAAVAATIIGSASVGVGTSLWLQDVSVTNNNANVLCVLGFGTIQQGTNVLLRHTLGTSGAVGIEKTFAKAVNAGMTNQDLVFSLGAAGTIDLSLSYIISA